MPLRLLFRSLPGYGAMGQNVQIHTGVGYARTLDLGFPATPFVIVAGNSTDSDPILVAGYNSFMCLINIANAGGTVTFSYVIDDPLDQTQIVARTVAGGLPAGTVVEAFGAYGPSAPAALRGDSFHTMTLRLAAVTANQTINDVRLWASVR